MRSRSIEVIHYILRYAVANGTIKPGGKNIIKILPARMIFFVVKIKLYALLNISSVGKKRTTLSIDYSRRSKQIIKIYIRCTPQFLHTTHTKTTR